MDILRKTALTFCLICTLALSGCAKLNSIWGEDAPERKTVVIEGETLPSIELIVNSDDAVAESTLATWRKSINETFSQIKGQHENRLTLAEIEVLVRKGFVKFDPDPEVSVKKARAALTLIGFKGGISSDQVNALFDWAALNRKKIRRFYQIFIQTPEGAPALWTSVDLAHILQLFGSFVELGGTYSVSQTEMSELIRPWIPAKFIHAQMGLDSGIDLAVSFFASLCGDRVDGSNWHGQRIGRCIGDLSKHFEPTYPVFDFILGRINPIQNRETLTLASSILNTTISSWLNGHGHPAFQTVKISDFAESIEIPAPYAFFQLMSWIPKLNAASTSEQIDPTLFVELSRVFEAWSKNFLAATQTHQEQYLACSESTWEQCLFLGEHPVAKQLFNTEYAIPIRKPNLGYLSKVALYDEISGFLNDQLKVDQGFSNINELVTVTIRLLDTNAFAFNVLQRLQEKPVDPATTEASLKSLNRSGLAELAALAADIIPEREQSRRGFMKRIAAHIHDDEKESPYALDRLGVTSFVYLYDLLSSLRYRYLEELDLPILYEGPLKFVKRKKVVEAIPSILYEHFPRIYNECMEWGFERTCGVLFTEVLPNPLPGRDDLETYEMDVVTVTAIFLESMMTRCDRNGDDRISHQFFDGFDEKHCVINISHALVKRLMKAKILEDDPGTRFLLGMFRNVGLVRWAGKEMLGRGSRRGNVLKLLPPFSLFTKAASLGSIISLAAETMDSDKVKAIINETMPEQSDPGDELIYLQQMTRFHLPSPKPAIRHELSLK